MGDKTMGDLFISFVRTLVPSIVGAVLAYMASKGITVDAEFAANLAGVLTVLFTSAYYLIARYLERKNPAWGKLLGIAKKPTYS